MFAKPYKHKSNNTLKNSEKKHLVQRVLAEFNLPSEEVAKELIPSKSTCICMKLVLHSGEYANVYAVDGIPMLLETPDCLFPTVCALWKVPGLVPTLTIHTPVLSKIQNGAPLYLPGISIPQEGRGFPLFHAGTILAANTEENGAACLVGRSTMSSADMLLRTTGICMDVVQVYGDQLSKDNKFSKVERPKVPPTTAQTQFTLNLTAEIQQISLQPLKEDWPALGRSSPTPTPAPVVQNEPRIITEENTNTEQEDNELVDTINETMATDVSESEDSIPTDMDGLLRWCLLGFLKSQGKTVQLPFKTNLLYKNHLHPLCPSDRTLDVKKSSYKKLGKFLEAMQEEGLIEVREVEKGVSAITAVNLAHPLVRAHVPPPRAASPPPPAADYTPPRVREMLCVTAAVVPLLAPHKKGTALTPPEVRAAVTEYVKHKNLNSQQVKGAVTLDPLLAKIVGKPEQECVKWDVLMSSIQSKMTASTEMVFADGTVSLTKAKLEPVKMSVATRSGNKKVTLVSNLEQFGFSLPALASSWQRGAAGACGVTRSPASRADQLMLQGDQTHFVAKLLIEKYGLPKKFVEGADKALKKKK